MKIDGQRIVQLRQAKGWSQRNLAKQAQLSQTLVSLIELGQRNATLTSAGRLAHALGVNLTDLLIEEVIPTGAIA